MGKDIGNGASKKLFILFKKIVSGGVMEWGLNMLERCSPNKLALLTSDIASEPFGFLIGHESSFNFRRFLVIFHNEPSFIFKDFYFNSKYSFLCFSISLLMVFFRLLNVCLLEGSLVLCQREWTMRFFAISYFILKGKI
jgi:hypothetical protein